MSYFSKFKIKRIIKKLLFILPNIIGIIIAPFFVIFIRLLKSKRLIRYGFILSSRVGHLIGNMDTYLCYKSQGLQDDDLYKKYKTIHIFYCQEDVCNKEILNKLKKKVIILPRFLLHWVEQFDVFLDKFIKSKRIHEIGCYDDVSGKLSFKSNKVPYIERDFNGYYNNIQNFYLGEKDLDIGNSIFKELGINSEKKIICINARDTEYLNQIYPDNDWSRHDYRTFDIEYFNETIKYLIRNNYFVIRAGSIAAKESTIIDENFLDYPFCNFKSDLLDLYIAHKCSLLISTSSGLDNIYSSFRKPILWPSLFPIKDIRSSSDSYMASFRHLEREDKTKLTFKEVLNLNLDYCYNSSLLKKNNLFLSKPNSIDIMETTKDMLNHLNHNYEFSDKEENLKNKFFEIFENSNYFNNFQRFHKKINFKVSKYFLNQNEWWLS